MTTVELSTAWFSHIEQPRHAMPPPPAAHLWPRAVGTLGLLPALQGGGTRPCSRWVPRDSRALFPRLPARTRLLRLLKPQQDWTQGCWAAPTVLGGSATEGSAWLPPRRAGRRPPPRGRTGLANPRWMGGGTLWLLVKQDGLVVGGDGAAAHGANHALQGRRRQGDGRRSVLRETACQAAAGEPAHLPLGPRGAWEDCRLVATVCSRLTVGCHCHKVRPRVWASLQARRPGLLVHCWCGTTPPRTRRP